MARGNFSPIALQQMLLAQAAIDVQHKHKQILLAFLQAHPEPISKEELSRSVSQGFYQQDIADLIKTCRSNLWIQANQDSSRDLLTRTYSLTPRGLRAAKTHLVQQQA